MSTKETHAMNADISPDFEEIQQRDKAWSKGFALVEHGLRDLSKQEGLPIDHLIEGAHSAVLMLLCIHLGIQEAAEKCEWAVTQLRSRPANAEQAAAMASAAARQPDGSFRQAPLRG